MIDLINKTSKKLAVLIDPDKFNLDLILRCNKSNTSFFLVGGSKLHKSSVDKTIKTIKKHSTLPVIIFPGDETQLSKAADGIFILSLVSGRNPDYLIGKQIKAAPTIKKLNIPTLPVAYILVNSKQKSATQKITKTMPLSNLKEITSTALAAQQLGFKAVYLEGGSGATNVVNSKIIKQVVSAIDIPVIVGGGITTPQKINNALKAGANVVVIGNALEKNASLIEEFSKAFE